MKKITLVILSLMLSSQFLFSQVFVNLEISRELYFGPKNVYPISIEVCQSYIEYLTTEQIKEYENSIAEKRIEIEKFNKQLDNLKSEWKKVKTALDSNIRIDDYCFIQTIGDTEFKEHDLEILENIEKEEIELTEYIDKSKLKLPKVKWEKTAVKNCFSANPDDCTVWCRVEFEKLFIDSNNEKLDAKLLTNEFEFIEEKDRVSRTILINIEESETLELYNEQLELKYSIAQLRKTDCK